MPFNSAPTTMLNRPDLGQLAHGFYEDFVTGPRAQYIAAQLAGYLPIQDAGQVLVKGPSAVKHQETTPDFKRPVGRPNPPDRHPGSWVPIQFIPEDTGQVVTWDQNQVDVRALEREGGPATILQDKTMEALASTFEGVDYELASLLEAATDPWKKMDGTSSEVDSTATPWGTKTNDIRSVIKSARANFGRRVDAVILSDDLDLDFRNNDTIVEMFGGTAGVGVLSDEQVLQAWNTMTGAREVWVGSSDIYGRVCTLVKKGLGPQPNPRINACGVVGGIIPSMQPAPPGVMKGSAPLPVQGVSVYHYSVGPKTDAIWAPMTQELALSEYLGVRIINC